VAHGGDEVIYVIVTLPNGTSREYWYTDAQWATLNVIMGTPDNVIKSTND
jgi:hypothetical protein